MIRQDDYAGKVKELARQAPQHEALAKLRQGYTVVNAVRLQVILDELDGDPGIQPPADEPSAPVQPVTSESERRNRERTKTYSQMGKEKHNLLTRRALLSNSFHKCQTDDDRAAVSMQIQEVQERLSTIIRTMRQYRYGQMTDDEALAAVYREDAIQYELQAQEMDGVSLMKKINSVRVRISQAKRKLETLAKVPAEKRDQQKIDHYHKRLKKLEIEKATYEQAAHRAANA